MRKRGAWRLPDKPRGARSPLQALRFPGVPSGDGGDGRGAGENKAARQPARSKRARVSNGGRRRQASRPRETLAARSEEPLQSAAENPRRRRGAQASGRARAQNSPGPQGRRKAANGRLAARGRRALPLMLGAQPPEPSSRSSGHAKHDNRPMHNLLVRGLQADSIGRWHACSL